MVFAKLVGYGIRGDDVQQYGSDDVLEVIV